MEEKRSKEKEVQKGKKWRLHLSILQKTWKAAEKTEKWLHKNYFGICKIKHIMCKKKREENPISSSFFFEMKTSLV